MPQYTVKDDAGRTVTFDWAGAEPPTDADFEEVFAAAGAQPVASHDVTPKPDEERTWTDTAVDALPLVGGSLGGILGVAGGPLGMAGGAALGGAGGEAWKQNINRLRGKSAPGSAGEAAKDIAIAGGTQAATEAVGGAVGRGLVKGGERVYRGLLKPSVAVRRGFGGDDVVRTLMDEGVTISEKGLDKASGALGASRAAALKMVDDAAPTSTLVQPNEIIREFRPVIETLRKRAAIGQTDELGKVGERGRRLVRSLNAGAGVDAKGAQALKETAQDAASGAYRAVERGGAKQLGADDLLDEATARGFRKAVEQRVPGVATQNQRTQRLLGANRALEDALERGRNNLAVGGARDLIAAGVGGSVAGPAGVSAGLLTRLLASPRAGSAAAIGLDRTGKNVPIDDLIRALQLAVQEQ